MNSRAHAALILAAVALFASLGGPAWAAGLINGARIENGSITSHKIGRGQIKAVNLATGSVTARTVADASLTAAQIAPDTLTAAQIAPDTLTAAQIAPNTFLATNGTAVNSAALGGVPADHFLQGTGNMLQHWIEIPVGSSSQFLIDAGLGEVDASCLAGDKTVISFTAEAQPLDLVEWGTTIEGGAAINSSQNMPIGATFTTPGSSVLQSVDFEVAQHGLSSPSRVTTIWTTGDAAGGTECIFTAQALTTGV